MPHNRWNRTTRRRPRRGAGAAVAIGLLLVAAGCSGSPNAPVRPAHVLFIGNSLTEANDLPEMVRALALAGGQREPVIGEVVRGGYSLGDHLVDGAAAQAIADGEWDVVVLQQGPSGLPESRDTLIADTRRFDTLIRGIGATTALFMVWPDSTRMTAFDSVSWSYRDAATAVGGLLFPAGDAWQAAWRSDATLPLYGPDGFHPSVHGSYLSALVIYYGLYRASPIGLPATFTVGHAGWTLSLPADEAATLQAAALAAALAGRAQRTLDLGMSFDEPRDLVGEIARRGEIGGERIHGADAALYAKELEADRLQ